VLLALLFVAAAVAVGMALALPRIALQSQRVREETLIYRGSQYKRAVELYFREHKKYPQTLDDLEDTNGIRYLRRRYKDPITGEDEWRLVHMGADGRFTDSLVHDTQTEEELRQQAGAAANAPPMAALGGAIGTPPPRAYAPYQLPDGRFRGADRARQVRESEAPDSPAEQNPEQARNSGLPQDPNSPLGPQDPAQQNDPYYAGGQDGQPPLPGQYPGYSRVLPSQVPQPGQAGQPGNFMLGQPGAAGNQQPRNQAGSGYGLGNAYNTAGLGASSPGAQAQTRPAALPAAFGAQQVGDAASIIQRLLTTPRPGGLAGLRAAQAGAGQQQGAFTGGIAGVASKAEERGIKVYGGQEQFNLWEFVYDYRQDAQFGANAGPQQQQGGQAVRGGQPGLGPSGTLSVTPGSVAGGVAAPRPQPQPQPSAPQVGAYPPGFSTVPAPEVPEPVMPAAGSRSGGLRAPYSGFAPRTNPGQTPAGARQPVFDPSRVTPAPGTANPAAPGQNAPEDTKTPAPNNAQPSDPNAAPESQNPVPIDPDIPPDTAAPDKQP
jgi:type II secretory pathway pseudopilin PulG